MSGGENSRDQQPQAGAKQDAASLAASSFVTSSTASEEDAALKARLAALSSRLSQTSESGAVKSVDGGDEGERGRAMGVGARILGEFVAAILVGAFIGWQIDVWCSSSPWGMAVFLSLGTAAGFWNIYRISSG